jgi:hypothetical protein
MVLKFKSLSFNPYPFYPNLARFQVEAQQPKSKAAP